MRILSSRHFFCLGLCLSIVGAAACGREDPPSENGGSGAVGSKVSGIDAGVLDRLSFAIVGDTRPPEIDDTARYPTDTITRIWKDVDARSPKPAFAISTGDYVFARPYGPEAAPQFDLYLAAKASFTNIVFPAMGNHECTGATASNCGPNNADGVTNNYAAFMSKMLAPLGIDKPYYEVSYQGPGGAWTAKLVFIAANAWDAAQDAWLRSALSQPTTYTFVIRHESRSAEAAPGVEPSQHIVERNPYTILIVGHTHKYAHYWDTRQIVVGNGGAPLDGYGGYGYVIARRRADGAMVFKAYDYWYGSVVDTFAVWPNGDPAD